METSYIKFPSKDSKQKNSTRPWKKTDSVSESLTGDYLSAVLKMYSPEYASLSDYHVYTLKAFSFLFTFFFKL